MRIEPVRTITIRHCAVWSNASNATSKGLSNLKNTSQCKALPPILLGDKLRKRRNPTAHCRTCVRDYNATAWGIRSAKGS